MIQEMLEQDKKQKQILEQLKKVEQPYQVILKEHYIKNKSLVEIACDLRYNYEYIKKANSIALKKFEEAE